MGKHGFPTLQHHSASDEWHYKDIKMKLPNLGLFLQCSVSPPNIKSFPYHSVEPYFSCCFSFTHKPKPFTSMPILTKDTPGKDTSKIQPGK